MNTKMAIVTLTSVLASISFLQCAGADSLHWHSSLDETVSAAVNEGKLILLLAGRETCGNCNYMKYTVFESEQVRQIIDKNYVCWFSSVDDSSEWYPYAFGLGNIYLPLICVIDPGALTWQLERSTGTQNEAEFKGRLESHLPSREIRLAAEILDQQLSLRFESELGYQYRFLVSEDLVTWQIEGEAIRGDGHSVYVNRNHNSFPRRFIKVLGFK